MALVGYESSDEEEEVTEVAPVAEPESLKSVEGATDNATEKPNTTKTPEPATAAEVEEKPAAAAYVYGPQMGPAAGPSFPPLEEADDIPEEAGAAASASASAPDLLLPPLPPPGSPYSANRALLRDLTLPSVPNMEIPASPRGVSPPPATSRKLEHFLELKRKGVHFNARLADAPAMRNPALADKMLAGFAGLPDRDHYRTVLPPDLWDPVAAFPRHAFREQLRRSQTEIAQARARAKGAPVEFVPPAAGGAGAGAVAGASATGSSTGGQGGGPGAGVGGGGGGGGAQPSAGKRKTRFDA
ncbi:HCNGP-like protein-domain-containing protein [Biscogniauxia mediterranea]|nr:HCNGP-like protein-domain-containing protein [Biscogniauxia mediterranea]